MNVIIDGAKHILDPAGYDHILFLIALVASFDLSKVWRVILLATAFTVGHSLTLLLASIDFLRVDTGWVEFLIQVSIVIMAITATLGVSIDKSFNKIWAYCLTLGIGLIHGLGFSSYFRMHVDKGENIIIDYQEDQLSITGSSGTNKIMDIDNNLLNLLMFRDSITKELQGLANSVDYEEKVDRSMEITGVLHKVPFRVDRTTNCPSSSCSTLFFCVGQMIFSC